MVYELQCSLQYITQHGRTLPSPGFWKLIWIYWAFLLFSCWIRFCSDAVSILPMILPVCHQQYCLIWPPLILAATASLIPWSSEHSGAAHVNICTSCMAATWVSPCVLQCCWDRSQYITIQWSSCLIVQINPETQLSPTVNAINIRKKFWLYLVQLKIKLWLLTFFLPSSLNYGSDYSSLYTKSKFC